MTSPSSSVASLSSPSVSQSTTPSSPTPSELSSTFFLITHKPSAAFLGALAIDKESGDRILLFNGIGPMKPLLAKASALLEDAMLMQEHQWERVVADDEGREVIYWKTKAADTAGCSPLAHLDVQTDNVCP